MSEINLQKFCGRDVTRWYLENPFSDGDWTYATDGRVMIRVPRRTDVLEIEWPSKTHPRELFEKYTVNSYRPFALVDLKPPSVELVDCDVCDGRGKAHDCPGCNCTCDECDGRGQLEAIEQLSIGINGIPFAAKYVRLLQALPVLLVRNELPQVQGEKHYEIPFAFRFDGGEGLLMPMRRKQKEHIDEPR